MRSPRPFSISRSTVAFGRTPGSVRRLVLIFLATCSLSAFGQTATRIPDVDIRQLVLDFKQDPRGPFQAIRWFCPDGSVIPARERCPTPGGIQHALHRDVVVRLQNRNGIYLGQILAGTPNEKFLDEDRYFSRLKQYQLEQFLIGIDDGWILRRARYYRGAFQAEDEESWGRQFLEWALSRPDLTSAWYFMLREAMRDLPQAAGDNLLQRIRAVSAEISNEYPAFLDLRVKIHGQPSASDTAAVRAFRRRHRSTMPNDVVQKMDRLLADLRAQYGADAWKRLKAEARKLPQSSEMRALVLNFVPAAHSLRERSIFLVDVIDRSRRSVEASVSGRVNLATMNLSLAAEALLFTGSSEWSPQSYGESLEKLILLSRAAHGTGLIEHWEWRELESMLRVSTERDAFSAEEFTQILDAVRRSAEWSIGTVSATYREVIDLFRGFEPLADGFLDDRLRSTVVLPLGIELARLSDDVSMRIGRSNEIMGFSSPGGVRGLNPGVAMGELVVLEGSAENVDFRPDRIYAMQRAPADLKPVGGIATVTEGNLVSHVQLLARNLGIPNAVLSPSTLRELSPYSGRRVFYAVSPSGVVRMKPVETMTAEEMALVEEQERSDERITVPTDRLDLTSRRLESLHDLRSGDSGRVCGPKAANLGQLSSLFPGMVAPGFIVPFGVFRDHMDQPMPDTPGSYWDYLTSTFDAADALRRQGESEELVEREVLQRLGVLRQAIERMPLHADFVAELRARFVAILGRPIGEVPVFVRSDTNMEDLKDFTGAGLNLTVPNVLVEADILQAIRRVWASPYRERGYRWRQRYLLNPENVYPSLLILKSVSVDKSGVMITAGISSGRPDDATVAFNRGVGGAVDGQAAESYLLTERGAILESPAREPRYTTLPTSGGVEKQITPFGERILAERDLDRLSALAERIRATLPGTPGIETAGPFDVELGFLDGEVWLFQTRPFVENRRAGSLLYLRDMDVSHSADATIRLSDPLPSLDRSMR